jgi:hypothetical protein
MNKIEISFLDKEYDFTYYSSWMDTGHHLFFVITDNSEAINVLQLDHFFINIDILQGGQYFVNIIANTPEEVQFKELIAEKVIEHHYKSKPSTYLN